MDEETTESVRHQLIAMRAIVRVWEGMQSPDTPWVLELLEEMLVQALSNYSPSSGPSGGLYDELIDLQHYLASVNRHDASAEMKPYLFERIKSVTTTFDHLHGKPATRSAMKGAGSGVSDTGK